MNDTSKRLTPVDLWNLPRVGTPAPAPDGSFVVVGVTTYAETGDESRERLWLVPTSGDRTPRALTAPDVSSSQPAVSPDGKSLAFVRKAAGGSAPQLHVMPLDGGEAQKLTDLPLGVSDPRFLPDGKHVLVTSSLYKGALDVEATRKLHEEHEKAGPRPHVTEERLYRFWDRWLTDGDVPHFFLVDVETGAARDLIPTSERFFDLMDPDGEHDVSPDGTEIAYAAHLLVGPTDLLRYAVFTVSIAGGEPRCLTPDNPADDRRPRYSPDGRYLVYGKKLDILNFADRIRLVRFDRQTGRHEELAEGWDRSPSTWEFLDADTLLLEVEDRGTTSLFRLSISGGGVPTLVARDGSLHGPRPARDGFVYVQHHDLTRPPEVARVPAQGGAVERLTRFTAERMAGFALARVEEMEIQGAGGDPVHLYLVLPPGPRDGRPYPLVQMIHGGPYGIHADGWHFRWNAQTFAAAGYAVALVNFHGSSSYGASFANAVLGDWGGKAAEDILRATDVLVERGIADASRLALAGGSFGGYMACWIPTQTDRFRCTIVHAPVFDTRTMCGGDVTQGVDVELGGAAWDLPAARDALDRHSPAAHSSSYRTPTLVTHGERDFRCTVEHGLELYGMLKAKGVPARLVHYPDENHWILKRRNSLHWYGEVLGWLARHLGAAG
ncbi:Alanyl dipeptidyl peptidase [Minicystis rosea]|nr:Alanyl dipeptidyl peptidase [Minicystis rosea]